jgi:hypothetical protein
MSLIPKIQLIDTPEDSAFDYKAVFDKCFINLDEDLKPAPTALGIGYNDYKGQSYLNNTFSYGEFSCIVAASKSKKTFFKSALIASFIGGSANNYFPSIESKRDSDYFIVDIDTEQGEFYAQRAMRRVVEMVGNPYANYLPFGVEDQSAEHIVLFIEELLKDPRYAGRIKWLGIDGIADLVDNSNDIEKSNAVARKLMKWRKEGNMHINTVIHKNSTSNKATGHLGSIIQKKAETVILLEDTDENPDNRNSPIKVSQIYSRGAPFDPFYFDLDENTALPKECNFSTKDW